MAVLKLGSVGLADEEAGIDLPARVARRLGPRPPPRPGALEGPQWGEAPIPQYHLGYTLHPQSQAALPRPQEKAGPGPTSQSSQSCLLPAPSLAALSRGPALAGVPNAGTLPGGFTV